MCDISYKYTVLYYIIYYDITLYKDAVRNIYA